MTIATSTVEVRVVTVAENFDTGLLSAAGETIVTADGETIVLA
jgi:hypothetical protein